LWQEVFPYLSFVLFPLREWASVIRTESWDGNEIVQQWHVLLAFHGDPLLLIFVTGNKRLRMRLLAVWREHVLHLLRFPYLIRPHFERILRAKIDLVLRKMTSLDKIFIWTGKVTRSFCRGIIVDHVQDQATGLIFLSGSYFLFILRFAFIVARIIISRFKIILFALFRGWCGFWILAFVSESALLTEWKGVLYVNISTLTALELYHLLLSSLACSFTIHQGLVEFFHLVLLDTWSLERF